MLPNIVLLIVDALRAKSLSVYGHSKDTSPFMRRLASEGVVFTNFYATTDQTDPSFTTILSGRYPLVHGIVAHGNDVTKEMISTFYRSGTRLLPEFLKDKGYRTIAIDWLGRWHKRGYDIYASGPELLPRWKRIFAPQPVQSSMLKTLSAAPSKSMHFFLFRLFFSLSYSHYKDSAAVFRQLARMLKSSPRPFFLLIHLWDVHTPFFIPKCYVKDFLSGVEFKEPVDEMVKRIKNDLWKRQVLKYHLKGIKYVEEIEPKYEAAINYVDTFLSGFVSELKDAGIWEDTYFFITGDHGDNLVRDGIFISHGGMFQRILKVPLIVTGPDIPSGKKIDGMAQHVDLVPTILDILHIDPKGYYLDGNSLLDTLETGKPARESALAMSSTASQRYAIIEDGYKLVYSPNEKAAMDKFGGIWFKDVKELYDLRKDDDDEENLIHERADIARELERKVVNYSRKLIKTRLKLLLSKL